MFVGLVLIFFLTMVGHTAWNTNFSTYIIAEKQIGTTVQSGLISTMASLGGVLGGFFVAGIATRTLKKWTVPVCLLLVAAPNLVAFKCYAAYERALRNSPWFLLPYQ